MKQLDPVILFSVFQEMLGMPLLWLLVIVIVTGTVAFIVLLIWEKGVLATRMLRSQALGVLGGLMALVLMVEVSSSGYTDAGGPADWFLITLVFGAGLIGTTIISYGAAGWYRFVAKR